MANPPVCKILDYGKWKYEAAQRDKESRRKATNVQIKEMKYRPKIGGGDFDTKTRKVAHFLDQGHKVKITIMFRGREIEIVSTVSHELRSPLTSVKGYTSPAAQPLGPPRRRPEEDDARAGPPRRRPRHPPGHRAARHQPARDRPPRPPPPDGRPGRRSPTRSSRSCSIEYPDLEAEHRFPDGLPRGLRRPRQGRAGAHQPGRERLQVRDRPRACGRRARRRRPRSSLSGDRHAARASRRPTCPGSSPSSSAATWASRPARGSASGSAADSSRPTAASSRRRRRSGQGTTFRFTLPIDRLRGAARHDATTSALDADRGRRPRRASRQRRRSTTCARSRPSVWASGRALARPSERSVGARSRRAAGRRAPAINEARPALERRSPSAAPSWTSRSGPRRLEAERLDLTEVCRPGRRPRPPPPRHPDPPTTRGRVRRHGLHGRRGPRGRDRLVQLRGAQLPAGPPGPQHATTRSTSTGRAGVDAAAHPHVAGADPGDGDAGAADLLGHAGARVPQRHARRPPPARLQPDRGPRRRPRASPSATWPAPSRRSPARSSVRDIHVPAAARRTSRSPSRRPSSRSRASSAGATGAARARSTGWIELGGCGMVHPNVLRSGRHRPRGVVGLRLRLRHRPPAPRCATAIDDMRVLLDNDIRFRPAVLRIGPCSSPSPGCATSRPSTCGPTSSALAAFDELGMVVEGVEHRRRGPRRRGVAQGARAVEPHRRRRQDPARRRRRRRRRAGRRSCAGRGTSRPATSCRWRRVGAVLPGDFDIGRRKMKGVESNGMLCSARELDLGDDAEGIMRARDRACRGTPLAEALGHHASTWCSTSTSRPTVPTPCRSRAWPATSRPSSASRSPCPIRHRPVAGTEVDVEVESPDLCPRFTATVLGGVQVGAVAAMGAAAADARRACDRSTTSSTRRTT